MEFFKIWIQTPQNEAGRYRFARGRAETMEIIDAALRTVRGTKIAARPISEAEFVRRTRPTD